MRERPNRPAAPRRNMLRDEVFGESVLRRGQRFSTGSSRLPLADSMAGQFLRGIRSFSGKSSLTKATNFRIAGGALQKSSNWLWLIPDTVVDETFLVSRAASAPDFRREESGG